MTGRLGRGKKEMARAPEGAAGQVWGGNASHTAGRGATPQPVRDDGRSAEHRPPKNASKLYDSSGFERDLLRKYAVCVNFGRFCA